MNRRANLNQNNQQAGNQANNAANNVAADQQNQHQPAPQDEEQQRLQRALQEENERLRRELEELRRDREQDVIQKRASKNKMKLPVPILDTQNVSLQKWFEKYEKEAENVGFDEEDKLRHLSLYVDSDTASYVLENEASGYQAVKELMMTDLEVKSNRQFETIMSRKFDWEMNIQEYVSEKQRAGKKLKFSREKVMEAISRGLPAMYRWIKTEDELDTLYEVIRIEKAKHREQRARSMSHEAMNMNRGPKRGGDYDGQRRYGDPNMFKKKTGASRPGGASHCFYCSDHHHRFVYDHISTNCPEKVKDEARKKGKQVNTMDQSEVSEVSKLIYFDVTVNGVVCKALYDPGASISAIDRNLARRLRINVVERPTAINSGQVKCGGVSVVNLGVHESAKLVVLYVIDYPNLKDRVLLGLNCLRAFGLTHDRDLNIVNFDGTFKIKTSASESGSENEQFNLLELNSLLEQLETEARDEKVESDDASELEAAINHLVVNDVNEIEKVINPELSADDREKVYSILKRYEDVFAKDKYDTGCLDGFECAIETSDNIPVCVRPYRMNLRDETKCEEIIDELIKRGICRESRSAYASPGMLAKKKGEGKSRLVVNYGELNKKCAKVSHPTPNMNRLFDRFQGKRWKAFFDIKNAFWSIKVKESDIHKTGFVTQRRHVEFVRMPFGYKNSPAYFQAAIYSIMRRQEIDKFVANYVDDLGLGSETFEEFLRDLEKFLEAMRKENIKLSLEKCKVAYEEIVFLGHKIGVNEVKPVNDNIAAVVNYPRPKSKAECQRLLGLVNYNRKFIRGASQLMRPIIDLIKKDTRFEWTDECEKAFESAKAILVSAPVLKLYDQSKRCYLFTDASGVGVAGVLKQKQSDGELHSVAYFSKSLLNHQKNYTATELELLAIVMAVDYWHHYLYDRPFTVITDHKALKYLDTFKGNKLRLSNWAIELGNYKIEVIYRAGKENLEADALSRAPVDQVCVDSEYQEAINMLTKSEVREFQKEISERERFESIENVLVRKENSKIRVIVEGDEMERELFTRFHNKYNHRGVETMLNMIRKGWAVKGLRKKLVEFTKNCETCIKNKMAFKQSIGFLSRMGPVVYPFDIVSIDTKGGFSGLKSAKKYLHFAIDHESRYVWTVCAKGQGENDLIHLMREVLKDGRPKIVLSDRFGAMKGNKFRNFLRENEARLEYICADSASSNGTVERVGYTLSDAIRCALYDRDYNCAWTTVAREVVSAYNDTPHSVTGFTPRFLLKGEQKVNELFSSEEIGLNAARELANKRSEERHAKNAFYYNKHRKDVKLEVGQRVYTKLASKLNRGNYQVIHEGPYTITRIISGTMFEIEREDGKRVITNKKNLRLKFERLEVD